MHGVYGDDEVVNEIGETLKHHRDAQLLYIESNNILYNVNDIRKNVCMNKSQCGKMNINHFEL